MLQRIFNNEKIPIINGCSINSKNICRGDLFLAIKGNHFDGHSFIEEATQNGASLILSEKNLLNQFTFQTMQEFLHHMRLFKQA